MKEIVACAWSQVDTVAALNQRFHSPFLLTAMDLSVEAEAFGCEIRLSYDEIPTVIGRLVTSLDEIDQLPNTQPGDYRRAVYLETAVPW